MKKVLFVVCTHGDELAGLNLFLNHPYGRIGEVEWKIIIGNPAALTLNTRLTETDLNRAFDTKNGALYEEKRAEILKTCFKGYDVLYDIHTTTDITSADLDDCIFVNNIDAKTLEACSYVSPPHIIWDSDKEYQKRYLTAHHPVGITLEYQKTPDFFHDVNRIRTDFYNIIHEEKSSSPKKILFEADRPVTQEEKNEHGLVFQDFKELSTQDKKALKLKETETYVPVFTSSPLEDHQYYCFLNRKIKSVGK
jgi:hypothetical protein